MKINWHGFATRLFLKTDYEYRSAVRLFDINRLGNNSAVCKKQTCPLLRVGANRHPFMFIQNFHLEPQFILLCCVFVFLSCCWPAQVLLVWGSLLALLMLLKRASLLHVHPAAAVSALHGALERFLDRRGTRDVCRLIQELTFAH